MMQLILASGSQRRKLILEQTGYRFEVAVSNFEEVMDQKADPHELVKSLSLGKANQVAQDYTDAVVLAADTAIVKNGEIIGKPKDTADAIRIITKLSGTSHTAMTGFTVIDCKSGDITTQVVDAHVTFRTLTEDEITSYVRCGEPMDKAGGYGAQDKAAQFIERIEGDFYTVVGLPICAVSVVLRKYGISAII